MGRIGVIEIVNFRWKHDLLQLLLRLLLLHNFATALRAGAGSLVRAITAVAHFIIDPRGENESALHFAVKSGRN